MGAKQSLPVAHNQQFTIQLAARVVNNGPSSPGLTPSIRADVYQYLNTLMFQQQIQNDLNAYFTNEKEGIIQCIVETIACSESLKLTIKGYIRVLKPTKHTKDLSIATVKDALYRVIPKASKEHRYPTRPFGKYLGSAADALSIRFHKARTSVRISPPK